MRISSLCPAGTEIVFAVGAGDDVVGVSHACDFPPEAGDREVVTKPRFDPSELSSHQIYNEKLDAVRAFGSVFQLHEPTLCGLGSDVLITPGPGELPLVALDDVRAVTDGLDPRPELLMLYPHHLDDVLDAYARVGFEVGRFQEASALVDGLRERKQAVEDATLGVARPRVAFIQWLDPAISGGFWIPQMIEFAGGSDALNTPGVPGSLFDWQGLAERDPDIVVVACEDMDIERARLEKELFTDRPNWRKINAVRSDRVFIGHGSYFTRYGPRLFDGLEALAWAIHPDLFQPPAPEVLQKFED